MGEDIARGFFQDVAEGGEDFAGHGGSGHKDEDVAQRTGDETSFLGGFGDALADAPMGGKGGLGFAVGDEFDAGHDTTLADIADVGELPPGAEAFAEPVGIGADIVEDAIFFEESEGGETGGASERVPCVGVSVVESFAFRRGCDEGVVDFLSAESGSDGEVAAGEAFRDAEDVGVDLFLFAGEEGACSAEPDGDFIGDEWDTVARGEFADAAEITGGMNEETSGPLDEGFDEKAGDPGVVFLESTLEFGFAMFEPGCGGVSGRNAIGNGGRDFERLEEEGFVSVMKEGDAADADGAEGVAVISTGETDEEISRFGLRLLPVVLVDDFEGSFDGGGSAVRVEDPGESGGGAGDEFLRESDAGDVGETEEGGVADAFQLFAEGFIDLGDAMAVDVAPEGGMAVDVAIAVGVVEVEAFAPLDDGGLVVSIFQHGREGMPDEVLIVKAEYGCFGGLGGIEGSVHVRTPDAW